MTTATPSDAVLDFSPTVGMVIDGSPPDDPDSDPWHVKMVFAPGFAGPPVHIHPHPRAEAHRPSDWRLTLATVAPCA